MDGEQRLIMLLSITAIITVSIVGTVLIIALWPYRLMIGVILVVCVVILLCVLIGVVVNEQLLRHKRVKYHTEPPLDRNGIPMYPFWERIGSLR
jgi:hypothetical protein